MSLMNYRWFCCCLKQGITLDKDFFLGHKHPKSSGIVANWDLLLTVFTGVACHKRCCLSVCASKTKFPRKPQQTNKPSMNQAWVRSFLSSSWFEFFVSFFTFLWLATERFMDRLRDRREATFPLSPLIELWHFLSWKLKCEGFSFNFLDFHLFIPNLTPLFVFSFLSMCRTKLYDSSPLVPFCKHQKPTQMSLR